MACLVSPAFSTFWVGTALAVYPLDVFRPANPFLADGIFVLDSVAYINGSCHWTYYVAQLLLHVYVTTGQRCIAVARRGLAFAGRNSYENVLNSIMSVLDAPKFMVWMACGNDLYPPRPNMQAYEDPLRKSLHHLLSKCMTYCAEHRFVFGGSSDVWQYSKHFPQSACIEYDRLCAMLVRYILSQRTLYPGIGAITGSRMLQGLHLVDVIGHLSADSMPQLCLIFRMFARWGMAGISRL